MLWFRGKRGGWFGWFAISFLVVGGLGWVTRAALRLEQEQLQQQIDAEHQEKLRLALWRLDSRISAILTREDCRPFSHFSAIFAPPVALNPNGTPVQPGSVLEPSPLLDTELPSWMLLHFQTDERGWESPQVLSSRLKRWASARPKEISLRNVTPARQQLLAEMSAALPAPQLLQYARQHAGDMSVRDRVLLAQEQVDKAIATNSILIQDAKNPDLLRDYASRAGNQSKLVTEWGSYSKRAELRMNKDVAVLNFYRNGEEWLDNFAQTNVSQAPSIHLGGGKGQAGPVPQELERGEERTRSLRVPIRTEVVVSMSPLVGVWLPTTQGEDRLLALRLVRLEQKDICQGIVLDAQRVAELLADEMQDLFPGARILPAREPDPTYLAEMMTALPFRLDPGPVPRPEDPGWTTLRLGLSLAWLAALVALLAVGLGGWSLLDLSERRIRFVSAVTHELRTPLTTLRLYLDMLLGGMIREERQREEYLRTLASETDRLTRLVGNVLDYSRLENHSPRLTRSTIHVADLFAEVESNWRGRCSTAGKELIVDNQAGDLELCTDPSLLGQVLGNLLDNACKYTREATDHHIWLRARLQAHQLVFEVEDRGPGVPASERRVIFSPFRRGRASDATTGGVGLGLALAKRWTRVLGGRLILSAPAQGGACFTVVLPRWRG